MRRPEAITIPHTVSKGPASTGPFPYRPPSRQAPMARRAPDHVAPRAGARGPANRRAGARGSLNDDLDEVAGFQLLVRLKAVQCLEPFNLMIERRHPG